VSESSIGKILTNGTIRAKVVGINQKKLIWTAKDVVTGKHHDIRRMDVGRGNWWFEGSCGCDFLYGKICSKHKIAERAK
jgi:hypothetical protein